MPRASWGGCGGGGGGEGRRNPVAWSEWRTSKFRRSPSRRRWCCELEQRNVTALNASPAGCNGVAWSARAPRRHRLRRRQPTRQRHLNWIKTSPGSTLSSLFFLLPPRLLRHGLSVFHTLTHSLRVHSTTTPSSCTSAGVSCFALLLPHGAAHADPRREGGGEEPNAHLLPKIVYDHRRLLLVVDSDGMWKRPPPSQKKCLS